jgi:hypothetical protein
MERTASSSLSQLSPRRVKPYDYSFDAKEAGDAYEAWGCNCGPGALAAMLGLTPNEVRPHIPGFDDKRYTNPTMMKQALKSLGVAWHDRKATGHTLCNYGLVRVQWLGPWTDPGAPAKWAYRQTHWIGSAVLNPADPRIDQLYIFDINCGWTSFTKWALETVPTLTTLYPRSYGTWLPTHRWELELS